MDFVVKIHCAMTDLIKVVTFMLLFHIVLHLSNLCVYTGTSLITSR